MTDKNNSCGISAPMALTMVFVVLKLTHLIDWSWLWVLSPLWISFALLFVLGIIIGIAMLVTQEAKK